MLWPIIAAIGLVAFIAAGVLVWRLPDMYDDDHYDDPPNFW